MSDSSCALELIVRPVFLDDLEAAVIGRGALCGFHQDDALAPAPAQKKLIALFTQ